MIHNMARGDGTRMLGWVFLSFFFNCEHDGTHTEGRRQLAQLSKLALFDLESLVPLFILHALPKGILQSVSSLTKEAPKLHVFSCSADICF